MVSVQLKSCYGNNTLGRGGCSEIRGIYYMYIIMSWPLKVSSVILLYMKILHGVALSTHQLFNVDIHAVKFGCHYQEYLVMTSLINHADCNPPRCVVL